MNEITSKIEFNRIIWNRLSDELPNLNKYVFILFKNNEILRLKLVVSMNESLIFINEGETCYAPDDQVIAWSHIE